MSSACWIDGWLDITPATCMYEVAFNPATLKYRHRIRRLFPSHSDPSIIIVMAIDAAEWHEGPPPPYPRCA